MFLASCKSLQHSVFRVSCPRFFSTLAPSQLITYQLLQNKVGILKLCNLKQKNALSSALLEQLGSQLKQIKQAHQSKQDYPKVLILTSQGHIFSSGHDIKEIYRQSREERKQTFQKCADVCLRIRNLPIPVVAQINGIAMAAGLQLMSSCDMIVASNRSKFSCSGIFVGLFCSTPAVPLIRSMKSTKKVFEMLTTGAEIGAEEALAQGLINKVVQDNGNLEIIDKETLKFVEKITTLSSQAIALGKKVLYEQAAMANLEEAYAYATEAMLENGEFEETKQGLKAFIDKKKPVFK